MLRYLAIFLFSASASLAVDLRTLPPPPSGYVWQALEASGGAIKRPISWTCRAIDVSGGIGYLIAEENLFTTADYRTGFKIKYTYIDPKKTYSASDIVRRIYQKYQKSADNLDLVLTTEGGFSVARFYYNESVKHGGETVTHYFTNQIMYKDSARLLIFISFDCPLDEWPEKKRYAEVMLSDIRVYDFDEKGEPNQK